MTREKARAIAEAYREASEHLRMDWTESALERAEGQKLSDRLWNLYEKWLDIASFHASKE